MSSRVFIIRGQSIRDLSSFFMGKKFQSVAPGENEIFIFKKGGCRATLYKTHKLMLQGKDFADIANKISCLSEPELVEGKAIYSKSDNKITDNTSMSCVIGGDESGKGDSFGPICFSVVFADGEIHDQHLVKDSKMIKNHQEIKDLSQEIRDKFVYSELVINPEEYNQFLEDGGVLSELMVRAYADLLDDILKKIELKKSKARKIVIDKFPCKNMYISRYFSGKEYQNSIIWQCKADRDVFSVSCASILSRSIFLSSIEDMSKKWGIEFPRGSSNIKKIDDVINMFISKHGVNNMQKVCKMHFKNVKKNLLERENE